MTTQGPEWVTLKEAAEIAGKSLKTVRRWATTGTIGAQKDPTGKWFVRPEDLIDREPAAMRSAELEVLTAELTAMRETFHTLAADLAAASERAGRAEAERDALQVTVDAYVRDRVRAELKAERIAESRRWWQRRAK